MPNSGYWALNVPLIELYPQPHFYHIVKESLSPSFFSSLLQLNTALELMLHVYGLDATPFFYYFSCIFLLLGLWFERYSIKNCSEIIPRSSGDT